jgi:hypothetical protein
MAFINYYLLLTVSFYLYESIKEKIITSIWVPLLFHNSTIPLDSLISELLDARHSPHNTHYQTKLS